MKLKKLNKIFITENSNSLIQYFRFAVSGGIAAGISVLTFYLIISLSDFHHLIANSISWMFGLIAEYLLNKFWVFHSAQKASTKNLSLFLFISLLCLLMSTIVIYVLVDLKVLSNLFGLQDPTTVKLTAKIISLLLNSFWDFFAKKLLVFRKVKTA